MHHRTPPLLWRGGMGGEAKTTTMKFTAEINVMPLKALLDPQGKAVTSGLKKMGFSGVENVRVGKHITVEIEAEDAEAAKKEIDLACKKLLSNPVIEDYHFELHELKMTG